MGRKSKLPKEACCLFQEAQIRDAGQDDIKELFDVELQVDKHYLYVGGHCKLAWKRMTRCWVSLEQNGESLEVSTFPSDPVDPPSRDSFEVKAFLGSSPRRGVQANVFLDLVQHRWSKIESKRLSDLEREKEEREEQARAERAAKTRSRPSVKTVSKASRFFQKNLNNIREWEDADDEVFNRRSHKEIFQERKEKKQEQMGAGETTVANDDGEESPLNHGGDDDEDDDEGEATFGDDLLHKQGDEEEDRATETIHEEKKAKTVRRLRKLRRQVDEDSEDDELFNDGPDVTTPLTQRVVTPRTGSAHKANLALNDNDADDEDDEEEATSNATTARGQKKAAPKNLRTISSFFLPKTAIKDDATPEKKEEPASKQKDQNESNKETTRKSSTALSNFFAPRRPATSKEASPAPSKSKSSSSIEHEVPTQIVHESDDETITASPRTPLSKKPGGQENTTNMDIDYPFMECVDEKHLSPRFPTKSPIENRLSGQKRRRLFSGQPTRKGHYGSVPPSSKKKDNAMRALELADASSPSKSPFSGLDGTSPIHRDRYSKPVGLQYSPVLPRKELQTESKAESPNEELPKWRGLRNLGNTCYINASLQLLFSLPSFVESLAGFNHRLVSAFYKVYSNVIRPEETAAGVPSARILKYAVDEKTDKFRGYQQRDAHEFLGDLLDQMHDELEERKNKHSDGNDEAEEKKDDCMSTHHMLPTDDFFRLNVEVCLKCKSCGYSRSKEEMYRYLSVDLDTLRKNDDGTVAKPTVEDCLEGFFRPEDREIKCEKCDEGKEATQTMRILSRPRALLVHLKRFKLVEKGQGKDYEIAYQKNQEPVELTKELTLNKFFSDKHVTSILSSDYSLQSIVYHIGKTANSGHYTADSLREIKSENRELSAEWVSYDDGVATETSFSKICGSIKKQQNSYVLLYSTR